MSADGIKTGMAQANASVKSGLDNMKTMFVQAFSGVAILGAMNKVLNKFDEIQAEITNNIKLRKEEIECDKPKLLAIAGECKKRRYEGFMINRSIRDMIKEIKSLMRVKLIRKDEDKKISYMPLCFETQIYEKLYKTNYSIFFSKDSYIGVFFIKVDNKIGNSSLLCNK